MERSETDVKTDRFYIRLSKVSVTWCPLYSPPRQLVGCYDWSGEEVPPALSNTKERSKEVSQNENKAF